MSSTVNHTSAMVEQVLTPQGQVVGTVPNLSAGQLVEFYRCMVFGRVFSDQMVALQRQGRMGTFSPVNGQEAISVAMAAPLQQGDWLLGSYREYLAYHIKGVPLLAQLDRWGGAIIDKFPPEAGCLPLQVVLGTQVLHAVGIAQAIKYSRKPNVVVAACGDGATSEGDFNEALNFAGVFEAPIVIVVINNGWAISTPRRHQTAAQYIADRGVGFGIPGYVVDGNDMLAVYSIVADRVARAREGQGPALIEAITYRLGAHTTADNPTKYREDEELEKWKARDPMTRYRKFLVERELLTGESDRQIHDAVKSEITSAIEAYEARPPLDPGQLFEIVFDRPTPQLKAQKAQFLGSGGSKK